MDLDTLILALASFMFVVILWLWHTDHMTKFDLTQVLVDSKTGKTSLMKMGQFTALLVSTWVLIHETRASRLSEWLFLSYMGVWGGVNIANKWINRPTQKVDTNGGRNDGE